MLFKGLGVQKDIHTSCWHKDCRACILSDSNIGVIKPTVKYILNLLVFVAYKYMGLFVGNVNCLLVCYETTSALRGYKA